MRKPIQANICLNDSARAEAIINALKRQSLEFSPRVLNNYLSIPNDTNELSVNYMGCTPDELSPLMVNRLKTMRQKNPNMVNILVPPVLEIRQDHIARVRQGIFQDILPLIDVPSVTESISNLRNEGILGNPLSVTLIGCGKLGKGFGRLSAANRKLFSRVNIYSSRGQEIYDTLIDSIGNGREMIRFAKSLEESVEDNPDLIIVANGGFGFPIQNYSKREELTEALTRYCQPKVDATLEAIKGAKGLKVIWPNDVGVFLWGAEKAGISPYSGEITSVNVDSARASTVISEEIMGIERKKYFLEKANNLFDVIPKKQLRNFGCSRPEDLLFLIAQVQKCDNSSESLEEFVGTVRDMKIETPKVSGVRWYGSHGAGWTDLENATCDGVLLKKVHPEFEDQYFNEQINRNVADYGLRLMRALARLNEDHLEEVPAEGIKLVQALYSYTRDPKLSLYSRWNFQGKPVYFGGDNVRLRYCSDGIRIFGSEQRVSESSIETLGREQDFQLKLAGELYPGVKDLPKTRVALTRAKKSNKSLSIAA